MGVWHQRPRSVWTPTKHNSSRMVVHPRASECPQHNRRAQTLGWALICGGSSSCGPFHDTLPVLTFYFPCVRQAPSFSGRRSSTEAHHTPHAVLVACGHQHTVIAYRSGLVVGWGRSSEGQLGVSAKAAGAGGDTLAAPGCTLPAVVTTTPAVSSLAASGHTTAVATVQHGEPVVLLWGANGSRPCRDRDPVWLPRGSSVHHVSVSYDGQVWLHQRASATGRSTVGDTFSSMRARLLASHAVRLLRNSLVALGVHVYRRSLLFVRCVQAPSNRDLCALVTQCAVCVVSSSFAACLRTCHAWVFVSAACSQRCLRE